MTGKKQIKITKLFKKAFRLPEEDWDDLQDEVLKLEQTLKEKQDLFFQLQRNKLRSTTTRAAPKKKSELFVRPKKLILTNSVEALRHEKDLMSMLSGVEVLSYVADDHCSIVYHMQHPTEHVVRHSLMINMKNGANEVLKSSLPLGFNLDAVLEGFDKVMQPECLISVRKALVSYYDRLSQYDKLKKMLNMDAKLFKTQDGSYIQITFLIRNETDESEVIEVGLRLEYRIYDIRPKQYSFIDTDLYEGTLDILKHQCGVFKKKSLHQAFKEAFIDGNGSFIMVPQTGNPAIVERRRRKPKHFRPPNPHYNNDDTFHPEDCSDSEDDVGYC